MDEEKKDILDFFFDGNIIIAGEEYTTSAKFWKQETICSLQMIVIVI